MKPGSLRAGFLISAAFAVLAHFGALSGGLVWDDVQLVGRDERIHSLGYVFGAFGDSFFGAAHTAEMYRPVVNASFALDWFLSGSAPGAVNATWFHAVNLLLHAANAGLVFLFLAGLTGRRIGAPLLAAVLFAVHPLAVEPVAWLAGRCDLLAAFFGLLAGTLLLESPRRQWLVVPAVLAFGLSLFSKASVATLPMLVALAVMAYRDVPFKRLLGKRLLPRFAVFVVPAIVWLAARTAVLGAPFPVGVGLRWKERVGIGEGVLGVGRAFTLQVGNLLLPARLCGDYASDPASSPALRPLGFDAHIGVAAFLLSLILGALYLRRARWAFPLLAFSLSLLPVLQVVRIGAITADRFLYFPMVFALLLVAEGLEFVFRRGRGKPLAVAAFGIFALFIVQSHGRADAWRDDVTFNRDVLRSYPDARRANQRLAVALVDRGAEGDRAEALELLESAIQRLPRPNEELRIRGALAIEDEEYDVAEWCLTRALEYAADPFGRADTLYNLAVLARRLGDDDTARTHANAAIEQVPAHRQARALLDRMPVEGD